jgi:hypothetical protein
MLGRSILARVIACILAASQAFAPGLASLLDAHPAAQSQYVQRSAHVDAPGTSHGIEHPDRCVLCEVATRVATVAPVPVLLPDATDASAPSRERRIAVWDGAGPGVPRSRAPPLA